MSGRNVDKRSAMEMVNEHWGSRLLDGGNTSSANINASKPVWWININPSKFKSDLHLLLAKEGDGGLIWLRIEGNSFPDVRKVFRVRQDNDCIDLEISSRHPKGYQSPKLRFAMTRRPAQACADRWRLGGHKRPRDSQSALVWRGTQNGLQSDSVLPFKAGDAIQGMGWSGCQMN